MRHRKKRFHYKKIGKRTLSLLLSVLLCLQIVDFSIIRSIAAEITEVESTSVGDTDTDIDSDDETDTVVDSDSEESTDTEEGQGTVNDEIEYEDLNISSDYTLTADIDVNNLNLSWGTLNLDGHQINIHGDFNAAGGSLNVNKGFVNCLGNFTFTSRWSSLIMSTPKDYVFVSGDFIWNIGNTNDTTSGTIEIKGDFSDNRSDSSYLFNSSGENKVVLSGVTQQKIVQTSPYSFINTLEITNTSTDGIYADKPISAGDVIRNGVNITYPVSGTFGWTLQDDEVIDTDLYLTGDELNLNGHTLTIHGNLTQAAGKVIVNGGTLNINQNYKLQSIEYDENNDQISSYSTGYLIMTNENDVVNVNGDFVTASVNGHSNKLTNGTLNIKGSFTQTVTNSQYNFAASDNHKVVFNGTSGQSISFVNSNSHFANVEFANTSSL